MSTPETTRHCEHITVSIHYEGGPDDERIQHTVSWEELPSQQKMWDRVKAMVDLLYVQVR